MFAKIYNHSIPSLQTGTVYGRQCQCFSNKSSASNTKWMCSCRSLMIIMIVWILSQDNKAFQYWCEWNISAYINKVNTLKQ